MSSEVFENREDDLKLLLSDIKRRLTQQIPKSSGETQKQQVRDAERQIEEANALLQEMDDEAHKAPGAYRGQMTSRIRSYRQDLDQLSRDIKRSAPGVAGGSRVNFGLTEEDQLEQMEQTQRARLLQGTSSLGRASQSLARSHQIAAETDQIGTDIVEELGTQREQLIRTRDRLVETDSNLVKSRKILNTMARRIMTNKMILAVVIFLELGILGGVVYWKFFSKKK